MGLFVQSLSVRRLVAKDQHHLEFLSRCIGSPWNPKGGTDADIPGRRGDLLTAGGKLNRMYITAKLISKYGRSENCLPCEGLGPSHSAEFRLRIEAAMIEAGDAYSRL